MIWHLRTSRHSSHPGSMIVRGHGRRAKQRDLYTEPACGLPLWIQFFRPSATGRMEFSAKLVLSSNSGCSKKRVSFFLRARRVLAIQTLHVGQVRWSDAYDQQRSIADKAKVRQIKSRSTDRPNRDSAGVALNARRNRHCSCYLRGPAGLRMRNRGSPNRMYIRRVSGSLIFVLAFMIASPKANEGSAKRSRTRF